MDSFINNIFKNKMFNNKKLSEFGFKKIGKEFVFSQKILDGQFELTVTISKDIKTRLIDLSSNDLYTLHLFKDASGTFVGQIREEYENVLNLIADKCCTETPFIFPQANRINSLIKMKYGDLPEFLWEKFPGHGVFRNKETKKWYAIILRIDKSKIDVKSKGDVEVLNVKLDKDEITELLKTKGFYPAYHMNKKNWITILLDDTISDEVIMCLIEKSKGINGTKNSF